jgi:hypothetical protein
MRFMMIVRSDQDTEAGVLPSADLMAAMGKYNDELIKAGILLAADGLHPSSRGARIRYSGSKCSVTDGPFAETKELIAGYWLIDVPSKDEAIAWAKLIPFTDGQVEIRQVFEPTEFPPEILPAEQAAREQAWVDQQKSKAINALP